MITNNFFFLIFNKLISSHTLYKYNIMYILCSDIRKIKIQYSYVEIYENSIYFLHRFRVVGTCVWKLSINLYINYYEISTYCR